MKTPSTYLHAFYFFISRNIKIAQKEASETYPYHCMKDKEKREAIFSVIDQI